MNILLISQCDKRALTETRRILDQFAERRGDRTWQTPITQCESQGECVPYYRWVSDYIAVIGGR